MRLCVYRDPTLLADVMAKLEALNATGLARVALFDELINDRTGFPEVTAADAERFLVPLRVGFLDEHYARAHRGLDGVEARFAAMDAMLEDALGAFEARVSRGVDHVYFQFGDRISTAAAFATGLTFKQSARASAPRERGFPYRFDTAERLDARFPTSPLATCRLEASFRGANWDLPARRGLERARASLAAAGLPHEITYIAEQPLDEGDYRAAYFALMRDSVFTLCPRGFGLSSIRFFETLGVGRVPVLIADDLRLPLDDIIPYERFTVRVPEAEVGALAEYLAAFRARYDLAAAAAEGHAYYRRYLADDKIAALLRAALAAGTETAPRASA